MRVLVYGDIGGSGGYLGYCKGLFGSGAWPGGLETTFVCATEFKAKLGRLDSSIQMMSHHWPASGKPWLRYLWHLWAYPQLVRRSRPDIEFYPSGNLRDFMRWPRSVTACHNLLPFDDTELNRYDGKKRKHWLLHRDRQGRMFERSSGVIFLSDHSRRVVLSQFPGIRSTAVIPHGIDESARRVTPRNYKLSNQIRLLYVSPVYHYKRQCELVKAVEVLRSRMQLDIQLRLVGGGAREDTEALRAVIDRCGGERFCQRFPFLDRQEVMKELCDADLFVFASSCECFPNTLLEAMASRLPIACSNRVGLPEILKDGGVYFNPAHIESITDALQRLIADPVLRHTSGERAHLYSLDYSWKRCAEATAEYLATMAGG